MPLIAEPFFVNGKLTADIVGCTQKEYEKYMSNEFHDDINSHRVSAKYVQEYFNNKGFNVKIDDKILYAESALSEDAMIQLAYAPTLTIMQIKGHLEAVQLSYTEFVDTYAVFLKTL